jgi:putative tricarboxylic transport membrane protein
MSDTPKQAGNMDDVRSPSSGGRIIHPVDAVLTLIIWSACGWLYYQTTQFDEVSFLFADNIGPEVFPQILIIFIAFFAVFMPFEHILLTRAGKDLDKKRRKPIKAIAWKTVVVLIAIVTASHFIGTLATMLLVCITVPVLWGERRLKVILPYAVFFTTAVTIVFNQLLGVHFEPGILDIPFIR